MPEAACSSCRPAARRSSVSPTRPSSLPRLRSAAPCRPMVS